MLLKQQLQKNYPPPSLKYDVSPAHISFKGNNDKSIIPKHNLVFNQVSETVNSFKNEPKSKVTKIVDKPIHRSAAADRHLNIVKQSDLL